MASIKSILFTQSAFNSFTCDGNFSLFNFALIAGYKDSRIRVVLPLPDIPVIVVNLPFGISIYSGLTVCIESVLILILPNLNISSLLIFSLILISSLLLKYGPIIELLSFIISSIVPLQIICPPLKPASGPISII